MDKANANVTDDQELAKVLESMNQQATAGAPTVPATDDTKDETAAAADTPAPEATDDSLTFEETPQPAATPAEAATTDTLPPGASYTLDPEPVAATPAVPVETSAPSASPELDAIKKDALEELRPLVDKLDLPADEKFDTLLLIIRSTDDKSLVGAAHDAARAIEDEAKRAQALLDVIKEIDYFSGHGQQPA